MFSAKRYVAAAMASLALLAGCPGKPRELTLLSVSGVVTLNGAPLQDGVVELTDRGTGFSAGAPLDGSGRFTIEVIPTGSYEVVVRPPYLPPPGERPPPRPSSYGPIRSIPKKYQSSTTSGLSAVVGGNVTTEFSFDLTQ